MPYLDAQGNMRDMYGQILQRAPAQTTHNYKWYLRGVGIGLFILWLRRRPMRFWFWTFTIFYIICASISRSFK